MQKALRMYDIGHTIAFHGDNLQITSKIPSIETTDWKPVTISSHSYPIGDPKVFIQWIFCSTIKVRENLWKSTPPYTAPFI